MCQESEHLWCCDSFCNSSEEDLFFSWSLGVKVLLESWGDFGFFLLEHAGLLG